MLHDVLGNLKSVKYLLPQALTQLGEGLENLLAEYNVYDTAGDPHESIDVARGHLPDGCRRGADFRRYA
ncbi:hypothetical protein [uncultured Serinicoccus sp.]|uniref:hypothetical protein n=1 Tax=uncultured Serinicoccus sp. TaxID=735514 RepID=UPI0026371781|nr:hypothetical protein [uncultured Serinicoccus sp.]